MNLAMKYVAFCKKPRIVSEIRELKVPIHASER